MTTVTRPVWHRLLLSGMLALTACSTSKGAILPPRISPPSIPAPSPAPSTPHDAALHSYRSYWAASQEAAASPPDQARQLLEPYTSKSYLAGELDGIKQLQQQGREPWGEVKVRVTEVAINGRHARIRDCQGVARSGLADADTHEVIPESTQGPVTRHVEALLDQDRDGTWRLARISILDIPCTPPSS